jgi:hypothetical protein
MIIDPESMAVIEKLCGKTPAIRMMMQRNWDVEPRETENIHDGIEKTIEDICGLINLISEQKISNAELVQFNMVVAISCLKILCERLGKYRIG